MSIAPQYTYRQLTSDDVTLLKELLRVFGHAFNDSETYQHAVPSDEYLTNLLGKENFIVVVAMMGKAVVGGLAAYVLEKFEQQRREIYIYDLAVSDAHRRKGVATGTINEMFLAEQVCEVLVAWNGMLVCFAVIEGMPEYAQQFLKERDVVARQAPIGVLGRHAHLRSALGESICGTERGAFVRSSKNGFGRPSPRIHQPTTFVAR
jgi:aminoglycoside 3-N-acetyltransferase I